MDFNRLHDEWESLLLHENRLKWTSLALIFPLFHATPNYQLFHTFRDRDTMFPIKVKIDTMNCTLL